MDLNCGIYEANRMTAVKFYFQKVFSANSDEVQGKTFWQINFCYDFFSSNENFRQHLSTHAGSGWYSMTFIPMALGIRSPVTTSRRLHSPGDSVGCRVL